MAKKDISMEPTSFILDADNLLYDGPRGLGLIATLAPLESELRQLGIELKPGDALIWRVSKSKTGKPIIKVILEKKEQG